ncbi:NAD(P)-dependent dehydrogenase (short-subunit alcohol dehydrogenase family) [Catenulispora sp. GP43]|uniref:SDR family NAD(P)-dependent oxidoreductase n=1 Tax=Catenulispora sp. GP43 TaxID=3156263 RepID=UPI0035119715
MTTPVSSPQLSGRRALVTGSTSGIGRSVALALAREGAAVVVSGRDDAAGEAVIKEIHAAGGTAHFVRADLAEGGLAVARLAREAAERVGGPINLLVNNAAVLIPAQSLTEVGEQMADAAFGVNVKAPALLVAALAPAMVDSGGGVIVNIGSISGAIGSPVSALYGATKAALHSLTASWAAELAPKGVRVNAVVPGPTMTRENAPYHAVLRDIASVAPDGRPGTSDEVADAVVFLAGDRAAHIHGATLPVDGGYLAAR